MSKNVNAAQRSSTPHQRKVSQVLMGKEIFEEQTEKLSHGVNSWPGWYYVTIVVKDRKCTFGVVENDVVVLSALGRDVDCCWRQIPHHHQDVELDDYVVMPNHVHGIIIINDSACRDVQLNVPTKRLSSISPMKDSLSVIIRTFKGAVTTWARDNGHAEFVWQERFHDHVIRNDADLHRIRAYIHNNPLRRPLDEENPNNRP
jgi:putative transposase